MRSQSQTKKFHLQSKTNNFKDGHSVDRYHSAMSAGVFDNCASFEIQLDCFTFLSAVYGNPGRT